MNISYFVWFGTMYLVLLMYQDYVKKMRVDDRFNWLMYGITISLTSHIDINFFYFFFIIGIAIIGWLVYKRYQTDAIGEADINSIMWIFVGFGIIGWQILMWWFVYFAVTSIVYLIIKTYVLKIRNYTPFYGIIFLSFVLTGIFSHIY